MQIEQKDRKTLITISVILLSLLSLYVLAKFLGEVKRMRFIGGVETHTITLTGKGEVTAVPDIAVITYTVREEAKTAKEAESKVAQISEKALKYLKDFGIADKDIKSESYVSYPKYTYTKGAEVSCMAIGCPPVGNQVITGYEVSQYVTVKVRDADNAGKIIQGLTSNGVKELSGPNFQIDDEDALYRQAREKAINDAREEAEILAETLGVRLGRVVSYQEGSMPYPMYGIGKDAAGSATMEMRAPSLPKGENKITSNVTVTFEIK